MYLTLFIFFYVNIFKDHSYLVLCVEIRTQKDKSDKMQKLSSGMNAILFVAIRPKTSSSSLRISLELSNDLSFWFNLFPRLTLSIKTSCEKPSPYYLFNYFNYLFNRKSRFNSALQTTG